ncbi:MAG: PQQ-like beta-propeller repeat protein, partial [Planctomycetales bacterium]|nr:PQQ-like beta-propeller repeat protein [Planctomycetales bacterium]
MPLFKPSQLPAALLLLAGAISLCPPTQAADWPMWRFDAQRSAASPQQLPAALQPLWQQHYGPRQPAWDDPLNLDLMTYDRVFEPIVLGNRLFMGFNDSDKLLALDTRTGQELWRFYAEGPVRLPPVGWQGRVYFCSDDGYLYCVSAETGELQWKFDGAPNRQQALGNRRLISAWPARGGPVIRDGNVYFCASIWPFMGTFLYALDADTGEVRWVNDSTGAQFIKQPHSAPSFAGVAPQGALVATESLLIVPGGRSVPAVFDRGSGTLRYFELNAGGKGSGGSFVTADEKYFYVHTREKGTRAFHLGDGVKTAFMPNEPVLAEGRVYSAELVEGQAVVRAYGADDALLWQVAADGRGDLILAGQQLVAAGADSISIIQLPTAEREAEVVYSLPVAAAVERLLVADDKLFAITLEGHLLAFGPSPSAPEGAPAATSVAAGSTPPASPTAAATSPTTAPAPPLLTELLQAGQAEGYALWFGRADDSLLDTLVAHSPFTQLAVVDHDGQRVNRLRRQLDAAGRYGQITAHHATAEAFAAPPYVAHQLFVATNLATEA